MIGAERWRSYSRAALRERDDLVRQGLGTLRVERVPGARQHFEDRARNELAKALSNLARNDAVAFGPDHVRPGAHPTQAVRQPWIIEKRRSRKPRKRATVAL